MAAKKLLRGDGNLVHLCGRDGKCIPCPHWYKGLCRNDRTCRFCHINPPEVSLKVAFRYFYNLVETEGAGQKKEIKRALDTVKEEIQLQESAEAERQSVEKKRAKAQGNSDATGKQLLQLSNPDLYAENTLDVVDDTEKLKQLYKGLQKGNDAALDVPTGLNPLIWRSRCVRALHVRVTRALAHGSLAMTTWLKITGVALKEMIKCMVDDDCEVLFLEQERISYSAGVGILANPAQTALSQELEETYTQAVEEMERYGAEGSRNAYHKFRHVGQLILEVHKFAQDDKLFWRGPGKELRQALLERLSECDRCYYIEEWMASVEAVKLSLQGTLEARHQKSLYCPGKVEARVRWLLKMLKKSDGIAAFQEYFDSEFGELDVEDH